MSASRRRRSLNFSWPVEDVATLRAVYLAARRTYREPDPAELSLTMSAFTETAYRVARLRMSSWREAILVRAPVVDGPAREAVAVTWDAELAVQLDEDWDQLVADADSTYRASGFRSPRRQVHKSDVVRVGALNGLTDWERWVSSCPNDSRRAKA